ncbi:MAG TPA: hypothetical protein VG944_21745 [Fimbriimonas sp.]|nr:hypothetical protein [Fimbriimonas sp.]
MNDRVCDGSWARTTSSLFKDPVTNFPDELADLLVVQRPAIVTTPADLLAAGVQVANKCATGTLFAENAMCGGIGAKGKFEAEGRRAPRGLASEVAT